MKNAQTVYGSLATLALVATVLAGCSEGTPVVKSEPAPTQTMPAQIELSPVQVPPSQENKETVQDNKIPAQEAQTTPKGNSMPVQNSESPVTTNSLRDQVKKRILDEFNSYKEKVLYRDTTFYTYAMLSDRHRGLQAFDYSGEGVPQFASDYRVQVTQVLQYSPVYFTYTVGGHHYVAITRPHRPETRELVNQMRGREDELDFIDELGSYYYGKHLSDTYYIVDLYAEDLLHPDAKTIAIEGMEIAGNEAPIRKDTGHVQGDSAHESPHQDGFDQILRKYGRELGNPTQLINKGWNVMLFESHSSLGSGESLVIEEGNDQRYYLRNHWQ